MQDGNSNRKYLLPISEGYLLPTANTPAVIKSTQQTAPKSLFSKVQIRLKWKGLRPVPRDPCVSFLRRGLSTHPESAPIFALHTFLS